MENKKVKNLVVKSTDVDWTTNIGLYDIMEYFQDIATEDCEECGMGFDQLREQDNGFWVITKMALKFTDTLPRWRENMMVETFSSSPLPLRFVRNFRIYNAQGDVCIEAKSHWCALDCETHQPKKVKEICCVPEGYEYAGDYVDVEFTKTNLVKFGQEDERIEMRVGASMLDMNFHLNNCNYTKLVLDCFTTAELKKMNLDEYEIHFLKEAKEGEVITFLKKKIGDGEYVICGYIGEVLCFDARIKLKK